MTDEKKRIKQANEYILCKLQRRESLATVPPEATWYPPRPRIEKDLSKLYPVQQHKKKSLSLVTGDNNETETC